MQHIAPPPCPLSSLLSLGWPLQLATVTFLQSSLPLQCPPGSGSPPAGSAGLRRAGWALMLLPLTNWLHGRALPVPVAAHFLCLGVALLPCFCPLLFPLPFLTTANPSVMRSSCPFQLFPEPCHHFQGRDGIQGFRRARPSPILGVLSVCLCVMTAIENVSIHSYTQGSWLVILALLR